MRSVPFQAKLRWAVVVILLGVCWVALRPSEPERTPSDGGFFEAGEDSLQESKAAMRKVSIPLRSLDGAGEIQASGRAMIEVLSVGAGKNGGGLMKILSPAIRAEGTSVEIDAGDLSVLAELSSALRELLPATEIHFRGLVVRGRGPTTLLECSRASVDKHEKWTFRRVRVDGGAVRAAWELKLSPKNSRTSEG
jgi:hypothetical protein